MTTDETAAGRSYDNRTFTERYLAGANGFGAGWFYFPVNCGFRFPMNAAMPSFWSSDENRS